MRVCSQPNHSSSASAARAPACRTAGRASDRCARWPAGSGCPAWRRSAATAPPRRRARAALVAHPGDQRQRQVAAGRVAGDEHRLRRRRAVGPVGPAASGRRCGSPRCRRGAGARASAGSRWPAPRRRSAPEKLRRQRAVAARAAHDEGAAVDVQRAPRRVGARAPAPIRRARRRSPPARSARRGCGRQRSRPCTCAAPPCAARIGTPCSTCRMPPSEAITACDLVAGQRRRGRSARRPGVSKADRSAPRRCQRATAHAATVTTPKTARTISRMSVKVHLHQSATPQAGALGLCQAYRQRTAAQPARRCASCA